MTTDEYIPSGRSGPHALRFTLLCAAALLPASWAYAWATARMGAGAGFAAFILAALLLYVAPIGVCRWGKVRNPARMGWIGLALGLLFWSSQWAAWAALSGPIQAGVFDIALWVLELLVLMLVARSGGMSTAGKVFCEASQTWAIELHVEIDFEPIADVDEARRQLALSPHHALALLIPRTDQNDGDHTSVTLYACRGGDSYISINTNTFRPDVDPGIPVPAGVTGVYFATEVVERLRLPGVRAEDLLRKWAVPLPERLAGVVGA